MKKLLSILAIACAVSAQEVVAPQQYQFYTTTATPRLIIDNGPTYVTFECGIMVNCKTGEVKIPDGMTIDDASRKFWCGLASSFVGVREAWVSGYLASKR